MSSTVLTKIPPSPFCRRLTNAIVVPSAFQLAWPASQFGTRLVAVPVPFGAIDSTELRPGVVVEVRVNAIRLWSAIGSHAGWTAPPVALDVVIRVGVTGAGLTVVV